MLRWIFFIIVVDTITDEGALFNRQPLNGTVSSQLKETPSLTKKNTSKLPSVMLNVQSHLKKLR